MPNNPRDNSAAKVEHLKHTLRDAVTQLLSQRDAAREILEHANGVSLEGREEVYDTSKEERALYQNVLNFIARCQTERDAPRITLIRLERMVAEDLGKQAVHIAEHAECPLSSPSTLRSMHRKLGATGRLMKHILAAFSLR